MDIMAVGMGRFIGAVLRYRDYYHFGIEKSKYQSLEQKWQSESRLFSIPVHQTSQWRVEAEVGAWYRLVGE